jgi:hypothetical protein
MGLHSPFGYVGYEVQFGEIMIKLLDDLCGCCHTNDDYPKGCAECPGGQLIFRCKEYLSGMDEPDKCYRLYASAKWQAKREKMYGHKDPPEEIEKDRKMARMLKPEGDVIRAIKAEVAKIEPHPFFHSQWIWEEKRMPDPLLKLRELIKDLEFIYKNRFNDFRFKGRLETTFKKQFRKPFDQARLRLAEEESKHLASREK